MSQLFHSAIQSVFCKRKNKKNKNKKSNAVETLSPYCQVLESDYIMFFFSNQLISSTLQEALVSLQRKFRSFAFPPPAAKKLLLYQATLKYMNWVSQQMNILKCFRREGSEQRSHTNLVTADDTVEILSAFVSQRVCFQNDCETPADRLLHWKLAN